MENDRPRRMPNVPPFVKFVCANVPMVFDDSLSYYEALCALWKYIQGMTDVINNNATLEEEYIGKFNELKTFVDEYFDNLDVQEEINNKLDAMVEDGTLQEIITSYIQSNVTWTFDTVEEMQSATNLIAGSFAKTKGYYTVGDGGGAEYVIVDEVPATGFYETLTSDLYAKMIITNNTIYTKQVGAVGDGTTDDTAALKPIFDYVTDNKIDGFRIIVNGMHFVQPNQLIIEGTDSDNRLKGFVLEGSHDSAGGYMVQGINDNGFIFDTTDYFDNADFGNTSGIYIHYCHGAVVKNLVFTTNETVNNGELPLNAIELLKLERCRFMKITDNNLTCGYVGFTNKDGGGGYIERNNISLTNIGLWLNQAGDTMINDNHINTIGWNIYGIDGVLKSAYTTLRSQGHLYAQGIYVGGSGSHTIKGGKIEWCCIGIWQDYGTLMTYSNIIFDRCTVTGIAITGHNRLISKATITNNKFSGCGGVNISSGNPDTHISGIGRSCIGALQAQNILVANNEFMGDNGALHGAFKTSSYYYGPINAIYFNAVTQSSVVNNIIEIDNVSGGNNYGITFYKSEVLYDGNTTNAPFYPSNDTVVYKQEGYRRKFFSNNPNNLTLGNFDAGDLIYNTYDLTQGYRCGTAGTRETISATVSVVTNASELYPGDGSVIDLGTSYVSGVRAGAYVEIAGVTGIKEIVDVIFDYSNNHYYAKLKTPCDVAVLGATMTNKAPVFYSLS